MALSSRTPEKPIADGDAVCRIIVVDDSPLIRRFVTRVLDQEPGFKVVATAGNGMMAIDALMKEPADVIILDIDMPVMDGLTAIPRLKAVDPAVQIIMASTLTQRNAEISMRALRLGAADYVPMPNSSQDRAAAGGFNHELMEKTLALGKTARRSGVRRAIAAPPSTKQIKLREGAIPKPDIIAIGASTGGPQALFKIIGAMGAVMPQPVVITQHMPPLFTAILADHIARECGVVCTEAKDGEILQPKHYYIAPGDYHMLVRRKPEGAAIALVKEPAENYCRPAVDPMLRSVAESYGRRALAVILTGMGQDGCKGSEALVNAGGAVIAQDEGTSVVWGMPGAVASAGFCSAVLPVGEIGSAMRRLACEDGL